MLPLRHLFVLLAVCLIAFSGSQIIAQNEPPTPSPTETSVPTLPPAETATEVPSEIPLPTVTPTPLPSETASPSPLVTATASETATTQPEVSDTPSGEPSITPTQTESTAPTASETVPASPSQAATTTATASANQPALEPEPPLTLLFTDTFDTGSLILWNAGTGWSLTAHDSGQALQAVNSDEPVTFVHDSLNNVAVQLHIAMNAGMVRLSLRQSEAGAYTAILALNGELALYRGDQIIGTATVAPTTEGSWRTLRLSAINNILRVSVDDVEVINVQDATPLPPGTFSFAGMGNTNSSLSVDDVSLWIPTSETQATAIPTSGSTLTPTGTFEATVTPIETPLAPEPPLTLLFTDNFDTGELITWTVGNGWGLIPHDAGQALQVTNSEEPVTFLYNNLHNLAVQAQFSILSGKAHLSLRESSVGSYTASLDANGQVQLYRGETLLGSAIVNPSAADEWRTLRISTIEDVIRVAVDDVEVIVVRDETPLPEGGLSFAGQNIGQDPLAVDDFALWRLDPEPEATETPTVELSATPSETPTETATPEIIPTEPELGLLFSDNFDASDLADWTIGNGWVLGDNGDGHALQATAGAEEATLNRNDLSNLAVQASVFMPDGYGSAYITVRQSAAGRYKVVLAADGQVELYRDDTLLGSSIVPSESSAQWRVLRLSAIDDVLRVSVDGVETIVLKDADPLPAGSIAFGGKNLSENGLYLDNVEVYVPLTDMPLVTEPDLSLLFSDDFNNSDLSHWTLGTNWTVVPNEDGQALQSALTNEEAVINDVNVANGVVETRFLASGGSSLHINVRQSETGRYSVVFYADGHFELYRGDALLKAAVIDSFDATLWHTIRFSAIDDALRVSIDDQSVIGIRDLDPLPAGSISFSVDNLDTNVLLLDDVKVWVPTSELPPLELVPEPALSELFRDNFDDGGTRGWMQNTGWTYGFSSSSQTVETRTSNEPARFLDNQLLNVAIQENIYVRNGTASLRVRESDNGSYTAVLDPSGQVELYRGEELVKAASVAPSGLWKWRPLRLSAVQNTLRVSVDGVEVITFADANPLSAGTISFFATLTPDDPQALLSVDRVRVWVPTSDNVSPDVPDMPSAFIPNTPVMPQITLNIPASGVKMSTSSSVASIPLFSSQNSMEAPALQSSGSIPVPAIDTIAYTIWAGVGIGNPREEIYFQGVGSNPYAETLVISNPGTMEAYAAISPDGKRLAFASTKATIEANSDVETFDIYVVDLTQTVPILSGTWKRLTSDSTKTVNDEPGGTQISNFAPVWSPDGTQIAFESNRNGHWQIWVMDAFDRPNANGVSDGEGEHLHMLNESSTTKWEVSPAWSPDGRKIAYAAGGCDANGDYNIYTTNVYRVDPVPTCQNSLLVGGDTNGNNLDPNWSPDGQYIAFTGYRSGSSYPNIYIHSSDPTVERNFSYAPNPPYSSYSVPNSKELKLTVNALANMGSSGPAWSPDQTEIAFTANDPAVGIQRKVYILKNITLTRTGTNVTVNFGISWTYSPVTDYVLGHHSYTWNGPSWSQGAICEIDRHQGLKGGPNGNNKPEQLACLATYRSIAFAAFYNESSENIFRSLDDLASNYNFNLANNKQLNTTNYRYLFARTSVNGILDVVDYLGIVDRSGASDGASYFNNYGGSIAILSFPWLCTLADPPVPSDPCKPPSTKLDDSIADWLTLKVENIYNNYRLGDNSERIYLSLAYHQYLPYFYTAAHDVIYRDPLTPPPSSTNSQDPFARLYSTRDANIPCTKSLIKRHITCDPSKPYVLNTLVDEAPIDCPTVLSTYQQQLNLFYSVHQQGSGPTRYVQVFRYEFAPVPNTQKHALYNVIKDSNPDNDHLIYLYDEANGLDIINDSATPSAPLGHGRWRIIKFTWFTKTFSAPYEWYQKDANDTQYDPFFVSSLESRWGGNGDENTAHQGEPQNTDLICQQ